MEIKQIETAVKELLPLAKFMDVEVTAAGQGDYRCKVPLNGQTRNHFNSIHAAIQWAGAELLGGLVWIQNQPNDNYLFVLKEMTIRFLKPAMGDIEACAQFNEEQSNIMRATLAETGRHDFELTSEIKNQQGEVLATTSGTYAIRPKKID